MRLQNLLQSCLKNDNDLLVSEEGDSTKLPYVKIQGPKF